ncbi:PiggyBac transposable element-derived protein 4-like [Elysia marginata]|uniref:PiggyBac transposable element-derived protein 4-like n=1 Tax=Elysia marginata TaxID=1093978 RepID=A0AAV4I3K4_9GAST|nr:PiggyBac transposable element-derived protein 4-like [Elysia marginata]
MAFEFLQSLTIDSNLDGNDESDIEVGEMDEEEDEFEPRPSSSSSQPRPASTPSPDMDLEVEWSDTLVDFADDLAAFTEFVGPAHDLPTDSLPIDYFQLFFPDTLLQTFVAETNLYANQQQALKGVDVYWKPVNLMDMRKYIYTLITFGHHQVPELKLIWSDDPYWRVPAIADVWGRQRYQKVHQYFHLANSASQPGRNDANYDPLYKVRPLLDHIRNVCSMVYKPKRNLSVDEAMVAFTGRVSFKQYIKNKPTPWGFKIWCLAEAESGYLLNFQVYTGKMEEAPQHGLGHKWWRYLFNYLVQIAIINSFVLMKRARPNDTRTSASQNHLTFRTQLVKALIRPVEPQPAEPQPAEDQPAEDQPAEPQPAERLRRAPDYPTVAGTAHPYSPQHTLGKMPGRQRRCYQCAIDGKKMPSGRTRETTSGCHLCNVHLHAGECYAKFHSNLKN